MKKWLLLLLLAGCASGGHLLTQNAFNDVMIGSTQEEVISSMGKPVHTHTHSDGSVDYEYVERLKIGGRMVEERHYHIVLKDGKVISKEVKYVDARPYTFDSYEMQTTQSSGVDF